MRSHRGLVLGLLALGTVNAGLRGPKTEASGAEEKHRVSPMKIEDDTQIVWTPGQNIREKFVPFDALKSMGMNEKFRIAVNGKNLPYSTCGDNDLILQCSYKKKETWTCVSREHNSKLIIISSTSINDLELVVSKRPFTGTCLVAIAGAIVDHFGLAHITGVSDAADVKYFNVDARLSDLRILLGKLPLYVSLGYRYQEKEATTDEYLTKCSQNIHKLKDLTIKQLFEEMSRGKDFDELNLLKHCEKSDTFKKCVQKLDQKDKEGENKLKEVEAAGKDATKAYENTIDYQEYAENKKMGQKLLMGLGLRSDIIDDSVFDWIGYAECGDLETFRVRGDFPYKPKGSVERELGL